MTIILWVLSSLVAAYCVASLLDVTLDLKLVGKIEDCWRAVVDARTIVLSTVVGMLIGVVLFTIGYRALTGMWPWDTVTY